jgi:hypothetical protein
MENLEPQARLHLLERLLDEIDHDRFIPTDEGDAVCLFYGAASPEDGDEVHQAGCTFASADWQAYRARVRNTE